MINLKGLLVPAAHLGLLLVQFQNIHQLDIIDVATQNQSHLCHNVQCSQVEDEERSQLGNFGTPQTLPHNVLSSNILQQMPSFQRSS